MTHRTVFPVLRSCCVAALFIFAGASGQTVQPSAWVPVNLGAKIANAPLTTLDQQILALIDSFQYQIDSSLNLTNRFVQKYLPQLQHNVIYLYKEYNLDHARSAYSSSDFTAQACISALSSDESYYISRLKAGQSAFSIPGRLMAKVFWLDSYNMLGKYDLVTSRSSYYTPLIISHQDDPDTALKATPYSLVRNLKVGYQFDDTKYEAKLKAMLMDLAQDIPLNPLRIYQTGFSFGAQQCLRIGWRYQDWFAAMVPAHNDINPTNHASIFGNLANLINLPCRLMHGSGDSYYTDSTYRFMLANGCPVEQIITTTGPSAGHDATIPFRDSLVLLTAFCDSHTLNPFPKVIKHNAELLSYTRSFWVNARVMNSGGVINTNYGVSVNGNTITIDTANSNVTAFDFSLSDSLLDMGQPVIVVKGADTLYNAMPLARISVTLKAGGQQTGSMYRPMWEILDSISLAVHGIKSKYYTVDIEDPGHGVAAAGAQKGMTLSATPNPFNPAVTISVAEVEGVVQMRIYDISGRMVKDLTTRMFNGHATWDASSQPSGIYIVKARVGKQARTKTITLIK